MPQSLPTPQGPLPRVIAVAGLSKSGKTTVAEALISELASRGLQVGSIKTMSHHLPSLSAEATDTRRHEEAGASVVVALHAGGTARFERGRASRSIDDVARLFPPGIRILICEGTLEPVERQVFVVCLRSPEDLGETLKTRRIPGSAVAAVSGEAASRSATGEVLGIPCFDVLNAAQRKGLVDLILERIGGGEL